MYNNKTDILLLFTSCTVQSNQPVPVQGAEVALGKREATWSSVCLDFSRCRTEKCKPCFLILHHVCLRPPAEHTLQPPCIRPSPPEPLENLHCTALPLTHTDHLDTTLEEAGASLEVGRVARELCWLRREMGRLVAAPLW